MSAICPRFTQNAWKKDLCSNCFKSKDEHKIQTANISSFQKTDISKTINPPKGIMKGLLYKPKRCKVNFPKDLTKIIGYGGDWSDSEESADDDYTPINGNEDLASTDDEDNPELKRLTKKNTDYNTNNGNLLGNPEENIKKSFAALKLGTPQVDSDGRKQTLKITVTPFGTPSKMSCMKAKFELNKEENKAHLKRNYQGIKAKESTVADGKNSPPLERAMEKSLLEEISETLEKNQKEGRKSQAEKESKIRFEITSLSGPMPKINADMKKPIVRNTPIIKDQVKPKVNVFPKYSDSESNTSDTENGISAYYDVVETRNGYENIPDGHDQGKDHTDSVSKSEPKEDKSIFSSSQYITDMLLSAKTHAASYSLHEGSFITSKITSDGLIVTKCNSDDALDSTGSSFDGSSDEETSYNMNRSESDSGIGISMGSEYQLTLGKEDKQQKTNPSSNSSDYEDIQLVEDSSKVTKSEKVFEVEKSRELAGEPDGSADPDGNVEAPALPKTPPPLNSDARSSFIHGMQKSNATKKPEVPAKPTVNTFKTFTARQTNSTEQQIITQLQQVIKPTENNTEKFTLSRKEGNDISKLLKKGRAPNPPPSLNLDDKNNALQNADRSMSSDHIIEENKNIALENKVIESRFSARTEESHSTIYTRNATAAIKSSSPVIREKDKRERATVNPKFRSLNTFNNHRKNQIPKPPSPEPTRKNLSMSEECLAEEKKKKKFSIKKFLRMGTSKTTDNLHRKDGIYSEIVAGDEPGVSGKPRLVIIHPIDINPTAVEVVKEINKNTDIVPVVAGKPPAPPLRTCSDANRVYEANKPARPPPPKSAELRRKQKIGFNVNTTGSVKCKSDNVYANLGEIRSAIAPRKPERTASMREREAQLELARKRQGNESSDTISVCSSNGGSVPSEIPSTNTTPCKDSPNSKFNPTESLSKDEKISTSEKKVEKKLAPKVEIFERPMAESNKNKQVLSDGLKHSVLKINNTIDSYLKDKREFETMCDSSKESPRLTMRNNTMEPRRNCESGALRYQVRTSLPDTFSVSAASCTRSEYNPRCAFNNIANIPRVMSASYCGSEMGESDIYSPYSFYGSEIGGEVGNDIHEGIWGVHGTTKSRPKATNRLRMRKGRSVVHKNIEDNYSAVVVANHEALAQVLDQLQQTPVIPLSLRPLANAINLHFEDFTIIEGVQPFVVGKRAFHTALWTSAPVTLALSADCNQISGVGGELNQLSGGVSDVLNPITEFCDLVPNYHLPLMPSTEVRMLQATISVLPRMYLDTLHSIGSILKSKSQIADKHNNFRGSIPNLVGQKDTMSLKTVSCSIQNLSTLNEENLDNSEDIQNIPGMPTFDDIMCREVGFIMLQLVNGLKSLQAKAIEEMPISLSNVMLCKEADNKEAQARLCVLQGASQDEDEPMGTLCKCAHIALTEMLPTTKLTPILSNILLQERSESLSKAKCVLEFILWGPSDVVLTGSTKEREQALQRWLDLERATVLHGLVKTRVELTVYDECHLMFLVRSNAKIMNEAAKIVSSFKMIDNNNL